MGNTVKCALRMLRDGLPVEKISEYTDLSLDDVQEFADLTGY